MNQSLAIAVLIPSLNPDSRLTGLVAKLRLLCDYPIILVNDGSREENVHYFEEAAKFPDVILLHHNVNLGKGRSLKTGFNAFLTRFPDGIGVCTADGDGQHLPEDIIKCCVALKSNPKSLVLGVRNFTEPGVPWKSYWGNTLTRFVFRLAGIKISDTQTGLRGIGSDFMKQLMNSFGERFEYETVMLLDASQSRVPFLEVPIKTVYLDGNSETHFNPFKDSVRIYNVILRRSFEQLLKFSISGLRLVLNDFLRRVSTLFGFLTAVRYGMGVVFTHVRCLSRSPPHSGWVDIDRFLALAGNRSLLSYYIINPGIVKPLARIFSLISIAVGRLQSVMTLRQVCGFRTGSYSTFETQKVFAA